MITNIDGLLVTRLCSIPPYSWTVEAVAEVMWAAAPFPRPSMRSSTPGIRYAGTAVFAGAPSGRGRRQRHVHRVWRWIGAQAHLLGLEHELFSRSERTPLQTVWIHGPVSISSG